MNGSSIVKSNLYDLDIQFSQAPQSLHKSTITKIENAWKRGSVIDRCGVLWIRVDELWIIWRTDKATAKELYLQVSKGKYRHDINGYQCLRGCEVIKFIYDRLTSTRLQQRDGLGFSKNIFDDILENSEVQLIALNANLLIEQTSKSLKKARIKEYHLSSDELTLEPLGSCDFSHIISVKSYPELADQMWNGLVVNKETHRFITAEKITNGDDLLDLCIAKGWSTNWYDDWKHRLENFY